jgi:hypothetical protein
LIRKSSVELSLRFIHPRGGSALMDLTDGWEKS